MKIKLFSIEMKVAFVVFPLLGWLTPAHAYLDPGTGSILLQGLLAAIASVTVIVGVYWTRVRIFFSTLFGKKQNPEEKSETFESDEPGTKDK